MANRPPTTSPDSVTQELSVTSMAKTPALTKLRKNSARFTEPMVRRRLAEELQLAGLMHPQQFFREAPPEQPRGRLALRSGEGAGRRRSDGRRDDRLIGEPVVVHR